MNTFDKIEREMAERAERQRAEIKTLTAATGMTAEELDADVTAPDLGNEDETIPTMFRLLPEEREWLARNGNMRHELSRLIREDMERKAKGENDDNGND